MDRYLALVYLTDAAEQADAWTDLQRALKAHTGVGLPRDPDVVRDIIERIHRNGRALSAFALAFMHEHGLTVAQDPALANSYYAKSVDTFREEAARGLPIATSNMGFMYAQGKGVPADPAQSAVWFERAADMGLMAAKVNLGLCHANGWGVPRNDAAAFALFEEAAEAGYAPAMGCAAHMLQHGLGVPFDMERAIGLLRRAAEAGDVDAWFLLGYAYDVGLGVEVDEEESLKWTRLAASAGHPRAQAMVAAVLVYQADSAEKLREALHLVEQASRQGSHAADYLRGSVLLYGTRFSPPKPEHVPPICDRLCRADSPLGWRLLGHWHETRRGDPAAEREAAQCYLEAAQRGDWVAQVEVGDRCLSGRGVPPDTIEAGAWFVTAERFAKSGASERLDRLLPTLDPADLAEVYRRAKGRQVRWDLERDFQMERA
jgi:TPR repeat protein